MVTFGLVLTMYRPIYDITTVVEHFQQAQTLLEETRDQKAELETNQR